MQQQSNGPPLDIALQPSAVLAEASICSHHWRCMQGICSFTDAPRRRKTAQSRGTNPATCRQAQVTWLQGKKGLTHLHRGATAMAAEQAGWAAQAATLTEHGTARHIPALKVPDIPERDKVGYFQVGMPLQPHVGWRCCRRVGSAQADVQVGALQISTGSLQGRHDFFAPCVAPVPQALCCATALL